MALLGLLLLGVAISFSLLMIGVFAGIVVLALKYGGGGRFRPSMEWAPADSENLHEDGPTQAEARGRRFYR